MRHFVTLVRDAEQITRTKPKRGNFYLRKRAFNRQGSTPSRKCHLATSR